MNRRFQIFLIEVNMLLKIIKIAFLPESYVDVMTGGDDKT